MKRRPQRLFNQHLKMYASKDNDLDFGFCYRFFAIVVGTQELNQIYEDRYTKAARINPIQR
jgi:hypothetical protein